MEFGRRTSAIIPVRYAHDDLWRGSLGVGDRLCDSRVYVCVCVRTCMCVRVCVRMFVCVLRPDVLHTLLPPGFRVGRVRLWTGTSTVGS